MPSPFKDSPFELLFTLGVASHAMEFKQAIRTLEPHEQRYLTQLMVVSLFAKLGPHKTINNEDDFKAVAYSMATDIDDFLAEIKTLFEELVKEGVTP